MRAEGSIDYDNILFEKLRAFRSNHAKKEGISAFVVFHDRTLQLIAREKPLDKESLLLLE
ncbi:HRDC domain-containing protein [bacterium]|nr:HRDC domain-containing protein [bacterium]